jgi:hypothetical protein
MDTLIRGTKYVITIDLEQLRYQRNNRDQYTRVYFLFIFLRSAYLSRKRRVQIVEPVPDQTPPPPGHVLTSSP